MKPPRQSLRSRSRGRSGSRASKQLDGHRAHPADPRRARACVHRGLGSGRGQQLPSGGFGPCVLLAEGRRRLDLGRDLRLGQRSRRLSSSRTAFRSSAAASVSIYPPRGSYQLIVEHDRAARRGRASGRVRAAQGQARGRRTLRSGAQARASRVSRSHRRRDFALGRGDPGHAQYSRRVARRMCA